MNLGMKPTICVCEQPVRSHTLGNMDVGECGQCRMLIVEPGQCHTVIDGATEDHAMARLESDWVHRGAGDER